MKPSGLALQRIRITVGKAFSSRASGLSPHGLSAVRTLVVPWARALAVVLGHAWACMRSSVCSGSLRRELSDTTLPLLPGLPGAQGTKAWRRADCASLDCHVGLFAISRLRVTGFILSQGSCAPAPPGFSKHFSLHKGRVSRSVEAVHQAARYR